MAYGDNISRQAAIDAFDGVKVDEENCTEYDIGYNDGIDFAISKLSVLPPAQPEPVKVVIELSEEQIREVLKKMKWDEVQLLQEQPVQLQPWQVMAAQAILAPHKLYEDGTLWVTVDDVSKVSRVIVDEGKSKFCRQFYMDAQPQRTGKCMWCERLKERNLRIEYYWIDEEGCTASFSEPHIVATGIAKFCPNCGAKITEGDAE